MKFPNQFEKAEIKNGKIKIILNDFSKNEEEQKLYDVLTSFGLKPILLIRLVINIASLLSLGIMTMKKIG